MDYTRIESLLEKYWECTSTQAEEEELRRFFTEPEVPSHLRRFKVIFEYQQEERQEGLNEAFDRRMLAAIAQRQVKRFRKPGFYIRAAAVMVLMIGGGLLILQRKDKPDIWNVDTCQTPEQALNEVQKALWLVSGKMTQGRKIVTENVEKMGTATRYIK